jgi:hypothetical protein
LYRSNYAELGKILQGSAARTSEFRSITMTQRNREMRSRARTLMGGRRRRRLGFRRQQRQGGVLGGAVEREEVVRRLIPCIREAQPAALAVREGTNQNERRITAVRRSVLHDENESSRLRSSESNGVGGRIATLFTLQPHNHALHLGLRAPFV